MEIAKGGGCPLDLRASAMAESLAESLPQKILTKTPPELRFQDRAAFSFLSRVESYGAVNEV